MEWIWVVLGIIIILIGLGDIFATIFDSDGFGPLSSSFYRSFWNAWRWVTSPLPKETRTYALSLGAPLMVPATLASWFFLEWFGFALIYYAGMNIDNFSFSFMPARAPDFREALYLSGITITTLGYGDITATNLLYQYVGMFQSLIGLTFATLAISYILNIYSVIQGINLLSTTLHHKALSTNDTMNILKSYFPNSEYSNSSSFLSTCHQDMLTYHEGLRHYPIVYYFHGRRLYGSLPYAFRMIGEMTAALRWGLPPKHAASQEPWLSALVQGYHDVTDAILKQFLNHEIEDWPEPVSEDKFEHALRKVENDTYDGDDDRWVDQFVVLTCQMREMACVEEPIDYEQAYERYEQWLPFAYRIEQFLSLTAEDLAYDLDTITQKDRKDELHST